MWLNPQICLCYRQRRSLRTLMSCPAQTENKKHKRKGYSWKYHRILKLPQGTFQFCWFWQLFTTKSLQLLTTSCDQDLNLAIVWIGFGSEWKIKTTDCVLVFLIILANLNLLIFQQRCVLGSRRPNQNHTWRQLTYISASIAGNVLYFCFRAFRQYGGFFKQILTCVIVCNQSSPRTNIFFQNTFHVCWKNQSTWRKPNMGDYADCDSFDWKPPQKPIKKPYTEHYTSLNNGGNTAAEPLPQPRENALEAILLLLLCPGVF